MRIVSGWIGKSEWGLHENYIYHIFDLYIHIVSHFLCKVYILSAKGLLTGKVCVLHLHVGPQFSWFYSKVSTEVKGLVIKLDYNEERIQEHYLSCINNFIEFRSVGQRSRRLQNKYKNVEGDTGF